MGLRLSLTAIGLLVALAAAAAIVLPGGAEEVAPTPPEEYRIDLDPWFHYELAPGYHQRLAYRAVRKGRGWQVQEVVKTRLKGATQWREGWLPRSIVLYGPGAYERARDLVDRYALWAEAQRPPGAAKLQITGHRVGHVADALQPEHEEQPAAARLNPPSRASAAIFSSVSAGGERVGAARVAADIGPTTLVSNLGQEISSNRSFIRDLAQGFTTGSSPDGYAVTSISIQLHVTTQQAPSVAYEIRIHAAAANGRPTGPSLGAFALEDGPRLKLGVNTFRVPLGTDAIQLDPDTRYVVVVDLAASVGQDIQFVMTVHADEDPGGSPSWSIADQAYERVFGLSGNNGFAPGNLGGYAAKIAVGGGFLPFTAALHQLGDDYSQASTCGGTDDPHDVGFRADPLGYQRDPYHIYYCHEPSGEWIPGRIAREGVDFAAPHQLITPGSPGYNDRCLFRDADGNLEPVYSRGQSYVGHNWDPISQTCTSKSASS